MHVAKCVNLCIGVKIPTTTHNFDDIPHSSMLWLGRASRGTPRRIEYDFWQDLGFAACGRHKSQRMPRLALRVSRTRFTIVLDIPAYRAQLGANCGFTPTCSGMPVECVGGIVQVRGTGKDVTWPIA